MRGFNDAPSNDMTFNRQGGPPRKSKSVYIMVAMIAAWFGQAARERSTLSR